MKHYYRLENRKGFDAPAAGPGTLTVVCMPKCEEVRLDGAVIGTGKTALDTCVWLLSQGVAASARVMAMAPSPQAMVRPCKT